jgi:hypothetical protein
VWLPGPPPVLCLFDRASARGVVWLHAGSAPPWAVSRPALPILHAFTIDMPWIGTHGGAVGRYGRFLLLAGKGRAGKTTAALACARAGWDYAGDDYVFANSATGRIEPLYASARLRADMASSFPELIHAGVDLSDDHGEKKHELRLTRLFEREQFRGGSLVAILLPRRRGAAIPELAPARRSDAFSALVTNTTMELPGWPKTVGEKLAGLVSLAPVFFVDTGEDPAAIPAAFSEYLDRL